MCPITLPDHEAIWLRAIEDCIEFYGEGRFGAWDAQEWIDRG